MEPGARRDEFGRPRKCSGWGHSFERERTARAPVVLA